LPLIEIPTLISTFKVVQKVQGSMPCGRSTVVPQWFKIIPGCPTIVQGSKVVIDRSLVLMFPHNLVSLFPYLVSMAKFH
jgi:hypothetical protein